jgi:FkbM family methyltransferase
VSVLGFFGAEEPPPPDPTVWEEAGVLYGWAFNGETLRFEKAKLKQSKKTGLWYRDGSFDRESVKECLDNYGSIELKGKTVLDLGANVGGFASMALAAGAAKVVAVEPCPYNFEVLKRNSPGAELIQAAVVPSPRGKTPFRYANSKRNSVSSSTVRRMNFSGVEIEVPSVSFRDLLDSFKPEVLKVDIEGAEYDILDEIGSIPPYVRQAAFEFHRGSEPYRSYPERFFPSEEWESVEASGKRFASLRDIVFTRRAA